MNVLNMKLIIDGGKKNINVEDDKKVAQILEENGVNYANLAISVNGQPLSASELQMPIANFGVREGSFISCVAHKNNA